MKKVLKRSLSLLLAITIIFSSAIVGLSDVELKGVFEIKTQAAGIDDLVFRYDTALKCYSVYDCDENLSGDLIIPSTYKGVEVRYIDMSAFSDCDRLISVTIPDSVERIKKYAFMNCTNLISVSFGANVRDIDEKAFESCEKLESVTLPDSLYSIGKSAFQYCESLRAVIIPNKVEWLMNSAFGFCTNLSSVVIGNSVRFIDEYTFSNCSKLTTVVIGNAVEEIRSRAFNFCSNIRTVVLPVSVKTIEDYAFNSSVSIENLYYTGNVMDRNGISIGVWNTGVAEVKWTYSCSNPVTPKVVTSNETGGIKVSWNTLPNVVKHNIYRRQSGSKSWVLLGSTTGSTFLDKNVVSGQYYCYSVRAYDREGTYSDFVQANTSTRKFMATPKLTTIYNHANGLAIKWNAVAGITKGYRVYRRGAGSTYWTYLGTTKNLYFIDSAVKNKSGEYFRYTVIADGDYHSKFDTTGLYLKRLANPTLNSAVSSKSGITVKWGAVKGTTGYYVYRKTASSSWVRIAAVGGTNSTAYLDKTARKGTTYTYTVRAVCGATTSAYNSGISCYDKY